MATITLSPLSPSSSPSAIAGYDPSSSPLAVPPHVLSDSILPELPPIDSPFLIYIDSQEQFPFTFNGLHCDSSRSYRAIRVRTEVRRLGDWTIRDANSQFNYRSMGDYSLAGFVGAIAIERKSMEDLHGTILGWDERRPRFERELDTLNQMQFAAVVVECSLAAALEGVQQWGKKSIDDNRRALFASVQAWQQKYRQVQWSFCDTRRLAEETCFDHLRRFWNGKVRGARRRYGSRFKRGGII